MTIPRIVMRRKIMRFSAINTQRYIFIPKTKNILIKAKYECLMQFHSFMIEKVSKFQCLKVLYIKNSNVGIYIIEYLRILRQTFIHQRDQNILP